MHYPNPRYRQMNPATPDPLLTRRQRRALRYVQQGRPLTPNQHRLLNQGENIPPPRPLPPIPLPPPILQGCCYDAQHGRLRCTQTSSKLHGLQVQLIGHDEDFVYVAHPSIGKRRVRKCKPAQVQVPFLQGGFAARQRRTENQMLGAGAVRAMAPAQGGLAGGPLTASDRDFLRKAACQFAFTLSHPGPILPPPPEDCPEISVSKATIGQLAVDALILAKGTAGPFSWTLAAKNYVINNFDSWPECHLGGGHPVPLD